MKISDLLTESELAKLGSMTELSESPMPSGFGDMSMSAKLSHPDVLGTAPKVSAAPAAEESRAYVRGFRGGLGHAADSTGVKKEHLPAFNKGVKEGQRARKDLESQGKAVPPMRVKKNIYGDQKPNPAFERLVKTLLIK